MTKTYQIKNRFTNAVMFEYTAPDDQVDVNQSKLIGLAVRKALESGAYMRGADMGSVDLRGVDLRGVDLRGVDLRGVDLRGVDLGDADLRGAYLGGADLRDAYLRDADLGGADLRDADLNGVDLGGAYLGGVDLRGVDLRGVDLRGADLLKIKNIDAAILAAIDVRGNELRMSFWHTCGTTHCRAGWAIHLAGDAGYRLEKVVGSAAAGALIYAASRPDKPVPDFIASDAVALADLRACAAEAA
jgi:hypothetical protein